MLLVLGLVALSATGPGQASTAEAVDLTGSCCGHDIDRTVRPQPDAVADFAGGIAARLRRSTGAAIGGDLYLLMATAGSSAPARLFESTPFLHDLGENADTLASNRDAQATAERMIGRELESVTFTTAPGGGPSGGLVYLMSYLNVATDGDFTGDLRIAATGELVDEDYLEPVKAPNEKLSAARLAGVDVLFTTAVPSHAALAEHADRLVGQRYHSRSGAVSLGVERQLDEYEDWGRGRPAGLDVVVVGHVADVAAYLCGAASESACRIVDSLAETVTSDDVTQFDLARRTQDGNTATEFVHGSAGDGSLR